MKAKNDKDDLKGKMMFVNYIEMNGKTLSYYFTPEYDGVDVTLTSKTNNTSTVELKYRPKYSSTSTTISRDGILIQKDKYEYLLRTISESGYSNSYYFMIFNDNVALVADIKTLNPNWVTESHKKTTNRDEKRNNTKINKQVYYIPIEKCKRVKMT